MLDLHSTTNHLNLQSSEMSNACLSEICTNHDHFSNMCVYPLIPNPTTFQPTRPDYSSGFYSDCQTSLSTYLSSVILLHCLFDLVFTHVRTSFDHPSATTEFALLWRKHDDSTGFSILLRQPQVAKGKKAYQPAPKFCIASNPPNFIRIFLFHSTRIQKSLGAST